MDELLQKGIKMEEREGKRSTMGDTFGMKGKVKGGWGGHRNKGSHGPTRTKMEINKRELFYWSRISPNTVYVALTAKQRKR